MTAVTRDVAEQVIAQVTEVTERRLAAHLDEVQDLVRERGAEMRGTRAAAVENLGCPNFENVLDALTGASDLNAISGGRLTVPANEQPTALRVTLVHSEGPPGWTASAPALQSATPTPARRGHGRERPRGSAGRRWDAEFVSAASKRDLRGMAGAGSRW